MNKLPVQTFLKKVTNNGAVIEYYPASIHLAEGSSTEEWVQNVKDDMLPEAMEAFTDKKNKLAFRAKLQEFDLLFVFRGKILWWLLVENEVVVGVGSLNKTDGRSPCLIAEAAAIFPMRLRGRRLYAAILRLLTRELHIPIESGLLFMNRRVLKAWKRMGVYHPASGRFRLRRKQDNPEKEITFLNIRPFDIRSFRSFMTWTATDMAA